VDPAGHREVAVLDPVGRVALLVQQVWVLQALVGLLELVYQVHRDRLVAGSLALVDLQGLLVRAV